jgi:hypothetical protein
VTVRRPARSAAGLLLLGVALVSGCGEPSPEERREEYCEQVAEDSERLTRISDEGGAGAFLTALPTLEELAAKAPDDLRDEWSLLIDALRGLRDALEDTGVEPAQVDGKLPADLPAAERRRIRAAASVLADPDVVTATQGIEQHALDICRTPLL